MFGHFECEIACIHCRTHFKRIVSAISSFLHSMRLHWPGDWIVRPVRADSSNDNNNNDNKCVNKKKKKNDGEHIMQMNDGTTSNDVCGGSYVGFQFVYTFLKLCFCLFLLSCCTVAQCCQVSLSPIPSIVFAYVHMKFYRAIFREQWVNKYVIILIDCVFKRKRNNNNRLWNFQTWNAVNRTDAVNRNGMKQKR